MKGRLLEAFGILFGRNVKLYVYPALNNDGTLRTVADIELEDKTLYHLLDYLKSNQKIEEIQCSNKDILNIFSDEVIHSIKEGKEGWEFMVPSIVANRIKENKLFGCNSESVEAEN